MAEWGLPIVSHADYPLITRFADMPNGSASRRYREPRRRRSRQRMAFLVDGQRDADVHARVNGPPLIYLPLVAH